MKTIKLITAFLLASTMASCYKPGKIQIQNNVTQVKLVDVKWGDVYIADELLPGESSKKITIQKYDQKLPSNQRVSFKMTANNQTIFLETEEEYLLKEDDDLLIILDNETQVQNPNG
jgi:hypothetical protein